MEVLDCHAVIGVVVGHVLDQGGNAGRLYPAVSLCGFACRPEAAFTGDDLVDKTVAFKFEHRTDEDWDDHPFRPDGSKQLVVFGAREILPGIERIDTDLIEKDLLEGAGLRGFNGHSLNRDGCRLFFLR